MNARQFVATAIFLAASCSAWGGGGATSPSQAIEQVKASCGFALAAPFNEASARASVRSTRPGGIRAEFEVRPAKWTNKASVVVVFNCSGRGESEAESTQSNGDRVASEAGSPRASVRDIVESEDAGGRYFRHIAVERQLVAVNWMGSVAYIDSVVGDGQRSRATILLACDHTMSRPCIEVDVKPNTVLRDGNLDVLINVIRNVAHVPF